jgi:hypothetical protein
MPELEELEIMGSDPGEPPGYRIGRWAAARLTWLLAGALTVALVAVAGLGAWLYVDHRDTRTAAEKARTSAAMAWVNAMNAHDLAALHRSMTTTGRVTFLYADSVGDGPLTGTTLDAFAGTMFDDDIRLTVTTRPVVGSGTAENQVWMIVAMHRGQDAQINHTILYLVPQNGVLRVDAVAVHY